MLASVLARLRDHRIGGNSATDDRENQWNDQSRLVGSLALSRTRSTCVGSF